jgi:hypothetical protein
MYVLVNRLHSTCLVCILWLTSWLERNSEGLAGYGFDESCFRLGLGFHIKTEGGVVDGRGDEKKREKNIEKQKSDRLLIRVRVRGRITVRATSSVRVSG